MSVVSLLSLSSRHRCRAVIVAVVVVVVMVLIVGAICIASVTVFCLACMSLHSHCLCVVVIVYIIVVLSGDNDLVGVVRQNDIIVVEVGDGGVLVAVDVSGDRGGVMVMVLLFLSRVTSPALMAFDRFVLVSGFGLR